MGYRRRGFRQDFLCQICMNNEVFFVVHKIQILDLLSDQHRSYHNWFLARLKVKKLYYDSTIYRISLIFLSPTLIAKTLLNAIDLFTLFTLYIYFIKKIVPDFSFTASVSLKEKSF